MLSFTFFFFLVAVENMQFKIMQNLKRGKLNYPIQGFIYIVRLIRRRGYLNWTEQMGASWALAMFWLFSMGIITQKFILELLVI